MLWPCSCSVALTVAYHVGATGTVACNGHCGVQRALWRATGTVAWNAQQRPREGSTKQRAATQRAACTTAACKAAATPADRYRLPAETRDDPPARRRTCLIQPIITQHAAYALLRTSAKQFARQSWLQAVRKPQFARASSNRQRSTDSRRHCRKLQPPSHYAVRLRDRLAAESVRIVRVRLA